MCYAGFVFTDYEVAELIRTDRGRRFFASFLASFSVMTEDELYHALCDVPLVGAEAPPDDRPTLRQQRTHADASSRAA